MTVRFSAEVRGIKTSNLAPGINRPSLPSWAESH